MSISAENKAIKIPASHYVGFSKREDDEIPLAFMTPDGTDAAALKRKATVDTWANRSKNKIDAQSFENKPLTGFKLGREVKHGYGWGQGTVKWRIEDPRGFELEISSPNLAQIMACTTIEQGEILETCVWARLANQNILLPSSSDVYKAATANTERMNASASLKDVKAGDYVVMQNGIEGRFLGSFLLLKQESYREHKLVVDKKKRFIVGHQDENGAYTGFTAINTPKLSSIRPGDAIAPADAERLINDAMRKNAGETKIVISGYGYGTYVGVTTSTKTKIGVRWHQFTTYEEAKQQSSYTSQYGHVVYNNEIFGRMADGRWGVFQNRHYYHSFGESAVVLKLLSISLYEEEGRVVDLTEMTQPTNSWHRPWSQPIQIHIDPPNQATWFAREATYETPSGYTGSCWF